MKLEIPSEKRRDSYLSLVQEFRDKGESFAPFVLEFPTNDFSAFLKKMEDCANGIGLPEGYCPHETFWLITNDTEVVAVSNLRHQLTASLRKNGGHIGYGVRPSARRLGYATIILAETLKKAKERGITAALITCEKGNTGSSKAILKNGGILDSKKLMDGYDDI
ncbi:MAG: GNAT family N-acetyltransferase, partial [Opitutaceae bacterium]|nr:GNAT family N-acetyltransferase [Opitutaceae bacterium]